MYYEFMSFTIDNPSLDHDKVVADSFSVCKLIID